MPNLRDYFDDPKALQLFKSMALPDQADVLMAVDPALAREHLKAVHHHQQMQSQQADIERGSSMRIPTVSMEGPFIPGIGHLPKFGMGEISTRPQDIAPVISAVPRALGAAGSLVGGPGAGLAAAGDIVGQGVEIAGGTREKYNPLETAAEAVVGAIPGGQAVRMFKPSTKAVTRGLAAAEGAAVGGIATALPAAAQGRMPTASEVGPGMVLGGTLGAASPTRQSLPRADYTEKAHKQIYAAIQPEASDTREFSEHLNAALPYIYANRKGNVNTITDMEQAARGTMRRLWNLHIEPVVAMNNHKVVPTGDIANSLRSQITRDTPKSVRKQIETAAALYDEPRSIGELNRRIKELNAETRGLQESTGKSARTLRNDPKTAWKFHQLNMLRSALAEQAGEITGSADMYMKLRKDWGALSEVADEAGEAAKRWEHQQKVEGAGMLPGVQRVVKSVKGGLGFGGAAAVRRGVTEAAIEYMSNPDRQIKGAFKRLRFSQRMSSQFPEPLEMGERRMLPAMGETGEPSIGDLSYRMPENRAAAKHARQRAEGSRLLTGQTQAERANAPAPGEPPPLQPGEMELSPGQTPRVPSAARPSPITIGNPPDTRISGMPPAKPRYRVPVGGPPTQGQTVPITVEPVPSAAIGQPTVKGQQLKPYSGGERRRVDVESVQRRMAVDQARANPEVAMRAAAIKDEMDANPSPQLVDAYDALYVQHPWITDWLLSRDVRKGGTRR